MGNKGERMRKKKTKSETQNVNTNCRRKNVKGTSIRTFDNLVQHRTHQGNKKRQTQTTEMAKPAISIRQEKK